jgi:hypothetical protein
VSILSVRHTMVSCDRSLLWLGNRRLMRCQNIVCVAVVNKPGEAIPLQSTWIGSAEGYLAGSVAARPAAADAGAGLWRRHRTMTTA